MFSRVKRLVKKYINRLRGKSEVDARVCGTLDVQQRGWYNLESGEIVKGFSIGAEDTVVDVGCGQGDVSRFAAKSGAEVIATDIDPQSIERLNLRIAKSPQCARPFRALVSDSNPLPIDDETATRVISMEVMEHVDDPQQFLRELVRIGKTGALYLISVPDPVGESIQKVLAPEAYWKKPNHLRVFQRDEFEQLIESAGLKIEHRTRDCFFWSMWWILFWASDQKLGTPEGPILENWTKTWFALINSPNGDHVREVLDDFMPKSQVIIARKAA